MIRFPKVRLLSKNQHRLFSRFYKQAGPSLKTVEYKCISENWLAIVVPVFNASARHLDELLASYDTQKIDGVELILSDDGSDSEETKRWLRMHDNKPGIVIIYNSKNQGIAVATNAGIAAATAKWITFLDHDDLIAPHGIKAIYRCLCDNPDAMFCYTDELIVNDKLKIQSSFMKPAFDPVLLSGMNYINHFSVYRRSRIDELGFLREGFDGSQDYDLLLRYLNGLDETQIVHLPYPAYWWRITERSYSRIFLDKALSNARRTLNEHFISDSWSVTVSPALNQELHKVDFVPENGQWPKIGIVIPSKNSPALISEILSGVFEKTDYPDFEVIVVDNGSDNLETLEIYQKYQAKHQNFAYTIIPEPFNFSRSINRGIAALEAEHYLLLNNDVEVINGGWLKEMVSCLAYNKVGIVGAKLLYANDTIQHAGVIAGFKDLAGHWYYKQPCDVAGPMGRLKVRNSMTCVTGAVMLISGQCIQENGPWDEGSFAVAYNDVDYCMRAHVNQFRVVWTPFACLYHHESISRGSDKSRKNLIRFQKEKQNLQIKHKTTSYEDPASNPFYSRIKSVASVVLPENVPNGRRWFSTIK